MPPLEPQERTAVAESHGSSEATLGQGSAMSELEVKTNSGPLPTSASTPSGPDFAVATQPSYARVLFFGPEGLRPGWGLAFYAVMFFPLQDVAVRLGASWNLGASALWSMLLEELGSLLAATIPAFVLARIEHRPWKV